jgi:hypothetical protein
MSARRALLVVPVPGGGGKVGAGGSRAEGAGGPACCVGVVPGWGRVGAPVVGLAARPVAGLVAR